MRQQEISGINGIIKVEVTKTANARQIKNLYKEAGWWEENDNTDPDLIDKILQGSFCFAVASINNNVIGMGRAISDGASDAYIQDVVVSNDFRGKGIAVLIMDELIDFLKSKNINWIALISEPKAASFYERYGFTNMKNYVPFRLE